MAANGLRFAYLAEGEGQLVVMLHGFPDTPHSWDAARPAVAKAGFRAVSPFLRGYAPTEVPADGDYDRDTLGRDVLAVIEALGEESAIVVGHDWGAYAAFAAALLGPERVRLLVTIAIPHPAALMPTPRNLWAGRHFVSLRRRGAAAMLQRSNFAYVDELVRRWSPAWEFPPGETEPVKEVFRNEASLDAALGYYRAARLPSRKKIEVPTVSFAGDGDIIDPRIYEKARRWYTRDYKVVAMPGGHFMHREHPEVFAKELVAAIGPYR